REVFRSKWGTDGRSVPQGVRASPFDAHDLLQGVDDFDQVGLGGHDGVDVLVGARDFVEDAGIFAAFDAGRLPLQICNRVGTLRSAARQTAAGTVRARAIRVRVALAAHDEGLRAHRARD